MTMIRALVVLTGLLLLAACDVNDKGQPPRPMGNFAMGLNIVVPETAQTIPLSREAKPEEWKQVMTDAMQERFGDYAGGKNFDFGISIDGYVLAPPGIPVVASPRSILIITVNVFDDAKQLNLTPGGKRLTIMEGVSTDSVIGSGWTESKEHQMKVLATNAAKSVQDFMLSHPEWLGMPLDGSSAAAVGDAPAPPIDGRATQPPPPRP